MEHKAKEARPVLKARRDLKEKKAIQALRALPDRRANVASLVLKGYREQREKKGTRAFRVFMEHKAKGASLVLKGLRDPQGQRGIQQIPAGYKTLKIAFPNWKRDSPRKTKELMDALCLIEGSVALH
jgi:hypothetical protein